VGKRSGEVPKWEEGTRPGRYARSDRSGERLVGKGWKSLPKRSLDGPPGPHCKVNERNRDITPLDTGSCVLLGTLMGCGTVFKTVAAETEGRHVDRRRLDPATTTQPWQACSIMPSPQLAGGTTVGHRPACGQRPPRSTAYVKPLGMEMEIHRASVTAQTGSTM
jgi:hypothetical protein